MGYFLLTGGPVVTGETVMDVCMKHVRATPDAPSKRLGRPVCPGLEALILRCLAKTPKDRLTGTPAMLDELTRCEPSPPWTRSDAEAWWESFQKPADAAATVLGQATPADTDFDVEGITNAAQERR